MMFGTDRMPASPLFAIWCAINALFTEQRLDFETALHYFTATAAEFEDDNRGTIAPGQKADLIVAEPNLTKALGTNQNLLVRRLQASAVASELKEVEATLHGTVRQVFSSGKRLV